MYNQQQERCKYASILLFFSACGKGFKFGKAEADLRNQCDALIT